MKFRQTKRCRLIILMLMLCMLTGAVSTALSESEMTEEQINEASEKAYDEAWESYYKIYDEMEESYQKIIDEKNCFRTACRDSVFRSVCRRACRGV